MIFTPYKSFLLASLLVFTVSACSSNFKKNAQENNLSPASTYNNPVFEPVLADPSVFRDPMSKKFYAYGTQDNWNDGQGSKLVPILESTDMLNWRYIGEALTEMPSWKKKGGIWAPDVHLVDGKYHMYYSYSTWGDPNPGIGLAIADSPRGPFVDRGMLFNSKQIDVPNSIDPFYIENKGQKYIFWGSFSDAPNQGIYAIELQKDGKAISTSKKHKIAAGDFEASTLYKRNGYYYFIGSKGSCCEGIKSTYHVLVARSKNLLGPYLDKQGRDIKTRANGTLLLKGNDRFVGTGHTSGIVQDDLKEDWIYYHAIDASQGKLANGTNRRVLMMDKLSWKDGWPFIDHTEPSTNASSPVINLLK